MSRYKDLCKKKQLPDFKKADEVCKVVRIEFSSLKEGDAKKAVELLKNDEKI